ncbi:MAG: hypothetical protein KAH22_04300 [Thiotrichaceae bacterium]|nr:hypothetical protein [Thiotrichaceae bacterium]
MKLLLSWILISSIISLVIVINAHKIIPVGEHTAKSITTSTELHLLNNLLKKESITKENLHSLIHERQRHFKGTIISSQLESLPIAVIYFTLLAVNSLNIIFIILGFYYLQRKN